MRKRVTLITSLMLAALAYGCANPADDKPKATVGTAAPESNSPKAAGTEVLAVTPENSKINFVGSKVTGSHNGSFKQFTGKIELAPNNIPQSTVSIDIDAASIEADDPQLTGHLKTPDFFDVAKFPKTSFASTKIEPGSGDVFNVTGNLDMHGVKKSITFPATIKETADSVSVNADFAINRKDFGIVYTGKSDDLIRDEVVLRLSLNVPRKK